MGWESEGREGATGAGDLAGGTMREERLLSEGRLYEDSTNWSAAVGAYQKLVALFPDNLDHRLRLMRVLVKDGKAALAMTSLEEARKRA